MSDQHRSLRVPVPEGVQGDVSARLDHPSSPRALLALAHGAGAGMHHPFMEGVAIRLVRRGIAVLRYQFPYMESGGRRPDRPNVATATVGAVKERAIALTDEAGPLAGLPVFMGGKSFGGRMTSQAAAEGRLSGIRGVVFLGFPLHPPGRPGTERAAHLADVPQPMLFLQGTRDVFAGLELLLPVVRGLDERAVLHLVDGADHGFHVLKRSGRDDSDVLDELSDEIAAWIGER